MQIPVNKLAPEILDSIIEETVTREGTEYGEQEVSLAAKVQQVRRQLARGEIFLSFDPISESCQLLPIEYQAELEREELEQGRE